MTPNPPRSPRQTRPSPLYHITLVLLLAALLLTGFQYRRLQDEVQWLRIEKDGQSVAVQYVRGLEEENGEAAQIAGLEAEVEARKADIAYLRAENERYRHDIVGMRHRNVGMKQGIRLDDPKPEFRPQSFRIAGSDSVGMVGFPIEINHFNSSGEKDR